MGNQARLYRYTRQVIFKFIRPKAKKITKNRLRPFQMRKKAKKYSKIAQENPLFCIFCRATRLPIYGVQVVHHKLIQSEGNKRKNRPKNRLVLKLPNFSLACAMYDFLVPSSSSYIVLANITYFRMFSRMEYEIFADLLLIRMNDSKMFSQ